MSWSINNLNNDLKRLKRLYNKETDMNTKYELSTYISCLEEIIVGYSFDNKTKVIGQGNFFKSLYSIPKYRVYLPFISEFDEILSKYVTDDETINSVKHADYSRKEMYELTREFYKQIGGNFYNAFQKFDKEKNNRINYCPFSSINSVTYYIPGIDKFYINIGAESDDRDIIEAYIHESAHITTAKINNRRYHANDMFVEIESLFFEILADQFLYTETGDIYFKDMEKDKVDKYYNEGDILDIMHIAYDVTISDAMKIDDPNKVFDMICRDNNLIKPKYVDFDRVMKYVFSYICAIELVEIYKQDKDKALSMLENIITENKSITEYEKIMSQITPCEHLNNYVKKLKKE